jgi:pimeloyl-ACP methyl ester carboxylesterase
LTPLFTKSPDGIRIAYELSGSGPALLLIHGGGSNRMVWHDVGYVERLKEYFTVITLDLRGHGESEAPTTEEDYTPEKLCQDLLAVCDACGIGDFYLWGMSFGGRISRYLAARSNRVSKLILIGAPLGLGISDDMRREIEEFREHWTPIIAAQRDGTLDLASLPKDELEFLQNFSVPVMLAWGPAMLDWPAVEPAEILCPTLWLVGSEDEAAMASVRLYRQSLKESRILLHIVDGLGHEQVFEEIDMVFSTMLSFTQGSLKTSQSVEIQ